MLKRLMLIMALALGSFGLAATPASADHTNVLGHWGPYGYDPTVWSVDQSLSSDSINFWANRFGPQSGNNYGNGCTSPGVGSINICYNSGSVPSGAAGVAYVHQTQDANGWHIRTAHIHIVPGLDPTLRMWVIRHEMGHAVGLGHTYSGPSVMNEVIRQGTTNQHDHDAMYTMYVSHWAG